MESRGANTRADAQTITGDDSRAQRLLDRTSSYRTWPVFLVGFFVLTALTSGVGFWVFRVGEGAYAEAAAIHDTHSNRARQIHRIQSLVWQSAILLRDVALAGSDTIDPRREQEFDSLRAAVAAELDHLQVHLQPGMRTLVGRLEAELAEYWGSQEVAFRSPAGAVEVLSPDYLRQQVVRRRLEVLRLSKEIDRLNQANLSEEAASAVASRERARVISGRLFGGGVGLALVVAGLATVRLWQLEQQWRAARQRVEQTGAALRRLSHQLVRAQEEERRTLSRELHDEIGQALTALRLEIGHLERIRQGAPEEFRTHAEEAKNLVETSLRTVRDLAMGLRPSMLDDFGLEPALGWQAREFQRHTGIPVSVTCSLGNSTLSDAVLTCLYRVAQEALTNCARHARAKNVTIAVEHSAGSVCLEVADDGVGFDRHQTRGLGLGLLGIEERVGELGGSLAIDSRLYLGTQLRVCIPLGSAEDTPCAR